MLLLFFFTPLSHLYLQTNRIFQAKKKSSSALQLEEIISQVKMRRPFEGHSLGFIRQSASRLKVFLSRVLTYKTCEGTTGNKN